MTSLRPRRSVLFLPASNPRAIAKARTLPADVIVLDLEDAVAPDAKVDARRAAVAAASEGFGARELVIRVNGLGTRWGNDDLAACAALDVAVLAPKVAGSADVRAYAAKLTAGQPLWAMVETCLAIGRLPSIVDTGRLSALVVGANDLATEMRARPGSNRAELVPILVFAVAAARSRGLAVIDAVCNSFTDLERVDAECAQGRRIGFDGKSLIHPAQLAAANRAFAPDQAEIAHAHAVVAAFSEPEAAGQGAINLGGRMVERLHLAEAERILTLASAIASRAAAT